MDVQRGVPPVPHPVLRRFCRSQLVPEQLWDTGLSSVAAGCSNDPSMRHHSSRHSSGANATLTAGLAIIAALTSFACRRRSARSPNIGRGARITLRAAKRVASEVTSKTAPQGSVVLLGDSVLDNFYWLKTPSRHLRVRLEQELPGLTCVNLAVDQMTTFDFEERKPETNSWEPYSKARRKVDFSNEQDREYRVDDDGVIRSAKNLAGVKDVSWCVLSIGGNDVYLNAGVQMNLLSSLAPPLAGRRQEVAEEFGGRLRGIVASIKKAAPSAALVLVVPYQPHKEFSLIYGAPINDKGERISGDVAGDLARVVEPAYLSELVTPMVLQIYAVARELGCPVLDLSKTFDPTCEEHYGTERIGAVNALGAPWSGVEPSNVSCGFIAQLIAHAVSRPPSALVYSGIPCKEGPRWTLQIKEQPNDVIFVEDYQFGAVDKSIRTAGSSDSSNDSDDGIRTGLTLGIGLALLANAASVLLGGDPIGFDRKEFEDKLKEQINEEQVVTQPVAEGAKMLAAAAPAADLPKAMAE